LMTLRLMRLWYFLRRLLDVYVLDQTSGDTNRSQ
jgi:hypothetical protein